MDSAKASVVKVGLRGEAAVDNCAYLAPPHLLSFSSEKFKRVKGLFGGIKVIAKRNSTGLQTLPTWWVLYFWVQGASQGWAVYWKVSLLPEKTVGLPCHSFPAPPHSSRVTNAVSWEESCDGVTDMSSSERGREYGSGHWSHGLDGASVQVRLVILNFLL